MATLDMRRRRQRRWQGVVAPVSRKLFFLRAYWLCVRAMFRYRMLYIYFNGGPLFSRPLACRRAMRARRCRVSRTSRFSGVSVVVAI